ncbi:MAG: hypothetical protein GY847_14650 [Proteobacteria bacterium]|nr:hypothetical protein [Pseudomonadota bacterium]
MRIVAMITDPDSARRYLKGTGQSVEIPAFAELDAGLSPVSILHRQEIAGIQCKSP